MDQEKIREIAETFFSHLGVEITELNIDLQDEERNIYMLKVQTPDSSLLIGPFGKTLTELQNLLVQLVEHSSKERCFIHLEVNDYLENKDKKLFSYVDKKIDAAKRTGTDQVFTGLTGYERKKVHAYVSEKEISGLQTFSMDGEDGQRTLHISYESNTDVSQEIDLDGVEI